MTSTFALLYTPVQGREELAGELFPQHLELYRSFLANGRLRAFGPWADLSKGSMALFTSRESAEQFMAEDPYLNNGLIAEHEIREWNDLSA